MIPSPAGGSPGIRCGTMSHCSFLDGAQLLFCLFLAVISPSQAPRAPRVTSPRHLRHQNEMLLASIHSCFAIRCRGAIPLVFVPRDKHRPASNATPTAGTVQVRMKRVVDRSPIVSSIVGMYTRIRIRISCNPHARKHSPTMPLALEILPARVE